MEAANAVGAKAKGISLNHSRSDVAENPRWLLCKEVSREPDKRSQKCESPSREAGLFSFSICASAKGDIS